MNKKILAAVLSLCLLAAVLSGCGFGKKSVDPVGVWSMDVQDTPEQAKILLEAIDVYEEEIALADLNSLIYVKQAHFREDGTFAFYVDAEGTKAGVRGFYDGFFRTLYENRTGLNEVYGKTFDDMTEADFLQFYAALYGYESYTVMAETLADGAYRYEVFDAPAKEGTYTVRGDVILCTAAGEQEPSGIQVVISGDSGEYLTMVYADGEETYTRIR